MIKRILILTLILGGCNLPSQAPSQGPEHPAENHLTLTAAHATTTPVHGSSLTPQPSATLPKPHASPPATATLTTITNPGEPWLMFHHDELHTGLASGTGRIDPQIGPGVRWTYQVTNPPSEHDFYQYRWYASFPLGDLDGDGTLEVVVTTPDNSGEPDRILALKDLPGQDPPVEAIWTYTSPEPHGHGGFDQYSAALADADGDGLLDVFFSSKSGYVRALSGITGQVIWEYDTNHFIEAGPMIADLDGDGSQEVILTADCQPGPECVAQGGQGGAIFVFATKPEGEDPLLWSLDLPKKADSGEPAVADLDEADGRDLKALVFGAWDGYLHVAWREANGEIIHSQYDTRQLETTSGHGEAGANTVIRSSPLLYDFGDGWIATFGWMPDWTIGTEARISAVKIAADMSSGTVNYSPLWTVNRDDWKSSPTLLPLPDRKLIVTGYGIGTANGTGNYGVCEVQLGGIIAIDPLTGEVAWEYAFPEGGNVRGSPAVADIDGDGQMEVLLTVGCFGKIYAFDGASGKIEWSFQLGPRSIGTPSIADLDGDGWLEIVIPSYDGKVWVLGNFQP